MDPFSTSGAVSGLQSWAQKCLMLALILLPIAVVPVAWFPFALLKLAAFIVLTLIAILLFVAVCLKQGALVIPKSLLWWVVLAMPVVYAISAYFSQNKILSWAGSGNEVGTVLFILLCALAFASVALISRSVSSAGAILTSMVVALGVVALFQIANLFWGPGVFGLSVFSALSSNLIGKWNDFGIAIGLLACISMVMIDVVKPETKRMIAYVVALVASLGLLAIVNLDIAWQVLAGAAVVVGIASLLTSRGGDSMSAPRRTVPFASLAVLIVSVLFLAWGAGINSWITQKIAVSELEVRPSAQVTLNIIKSTYGEGSKNAVIGTGPATFVEQWLTYKPDEVNASQFWNLDFTGGSGTIPTAFVTVGLIGGVLWLLIILTLMFMLVRAIRSPLMDPYLHGLLIAATVGSLFLMVASFLYLTGQVILLLAFALMGLAVSLEVLGRSKERVIGLRGPSMIPGYAMLAVLVIASLVPTAFFYQRLMSNLYVGKALDAGSLNDIGKAESQAMKALSIYKSEDTLRLLANIKFSQAQKIAQDSSTAQQATDKAQEFQSAFADAVKYGQEATKINPRNYQNWNLLGQLFEPLIPLKVQGAYDNAKSNYLEAAKRNPRNPGIFLSAARLEAQGGNEAGFKDAIQRAFALKPNYTDAALLVVQVEVARNNIDGAVAAAEVAAATAPSNAGVFFQLGLLKYTKGDNNGARDALEKALVLVPDYANAKYFLGLTYYRLQNNPGAIKLFSDLEKTNPDNQEVKLILANLQTGIDPFAGAEPPVTPNPETRTAAPIAE